ncbi:MAG: hypothetical protein KAT48_00205, partial [Bacteroidales bacterium]|nr:hypothetical protein [Bacteroidales bacterium]
KNVLIYSLFHFLNIEVEAIMFTDIVGYSAMMSKDEKQAMNVLEKNRNIHKSAIKHFHGEYIKGIGDGAISRKWRHLYLGPSIQHDKEITRIQGGYEKDRIERIVCHIKLTSLLGNLLQL